MSGFELGIALRGGEEKLDTRVGLIIGNWDSHRATEARAKGHYPVWNVSGDRDVPLCKDLAFEPDMKVTIYNREKTLLGDSQDEVLGEFSVQVCSLTTFCDKPQYFSVYNEDGQFIG